MYKYKINIHWSDDDRCYIADVPELPGCMSDGKTQQEAVSNAGVIINEWVETAKELGRKIPHGDKESVDFNGFVNESQSKGASVGV